MATHIRCIFDGTLGSPFALQNYDNVNVGLTKTAAMTVNGLCPFISYLIQKLKSTHVSHSTGHLHVHAGNLKNRTEFGTTTVVGRHAFENPTCQVGPL